LLPRIRPDPERRRGQNPQSRSAECEAWNAIMWADGPAMPSPGDPQAEPTIGKAVNGYMSYSEAALSYPQFASSKNSEIKTGTLEYEQYKLFVVHMLFAYDEMLKVYDHPEWRKSFDIDLATHRKYLCEESNRELFDQYYERTRLRIAALRKDCADKLQKSATRE
jgi:hypothetical protein